MAAVTILVRWKKLNWQTLYPYALRARESLKRQGVPEGEQLLTIRWMLKKSVRYARSVPIRVEVGYGFPPGTLETFGRTGLLAAVFGLSRVIEWCEREREIERILEEEGVSLGAETGNQEIPDSVAP